jgi:hypothetical protein
MATSVVLVACGNGTSNDDTPAAKQQNRLPVQGAYEGAPGLAPDERPSPAATLTCVEGPAVTRDADWLNRSVVVGHVVFAGARAFAEQPKAAFWPIQRVLRMRIRDKRSSRREREGSKKLLATVEPRSYGIAELHIAVQPHHRAIIAVPGRDARFVTLVYTRRARDHGGEHSFFRVQDGNSVLAFEGCPAGASDYQGGVVVAGPRCVPFLVYVDAARQPLIAPVGFGRPCPTK